MNPTFKTTTSTAQQEHDATLQEALRQWVELCLMQIEQQKGDLRGEEEQCPTK